MTIAYFDCFSGISGDMILGALIDLGVERNFLINELEKLNLRGYTFDVKKVEKNHIAASDVYITVSQDEQHSRSFKDIKKLIDDSSLDNNIKELSKKIFHRLAEVEGKVNELLSIVGLGARMHHKPTQMSGGEQQRVTVARSMVNEPLILLADEPTGELDTETTTQIMEIFAVY